MTNGKKYQIFLSSTFVDLEEEREAAISSILDLGHIPSGMELFPATDTGQFEYVKKVIDQCDYYVLVLKARYGSKDTLGISFTEREYDYAVASGKFVLVFPYSKPEDILKGSDVDRATFKQFQAFRAKAMKGRLVRSWETMDQLRSFIIVGLTQAFSNHPQEGWVRGGAISSDTLLKQMSDIQVESSALRQKIKSILLFPRRDDLNEQESAFEVSIIDADEDDWRQSRFISFENVLMALGIHFLEQSKDVDVSAIIEEYWRRAGFIIRSDRVVGASADTLKTHLRAIGLIEGDLPKS